MTSQQSQDSSPEEASQSLNFPPLTRSHVLHCSYHYWHPKYRSITPKARLIPLSKSFLRYLRADGIVLPPEDTPRTVEDDDWALSDYDSDPGEQEDPSTEWSEVHNQIKSVLAELGGKVAPKLNWSAPKDATWINATNSMKCTTPNDIYLLLKSSSFITHDLEHAFDDCITEASENEDAETKSDSIPYHLVLRKYIDMNPSVEFRCFVRNRRLLAICQRDTVHYKFLHDIQNDLRNEIHDFFKNHLMDTFPDPNFVFDVYIPPPHTRVWLIDINPWASRTDPILFSWRDILEMEGPTDEDSRYIPDGLSVLPPKNQETNGDAVARNGHENEVEFIPWFMLVGADGPSGLGLLAPQYSAHKLPKEVVDASTTGPGGMSEFLGRWQDVLERRMQEDREYQSEDE
ncbi:hypothetical protein VTO42DRAFT_210 [Malbranchea cinnamomea]